MSGLGKTEMLRDALASLNEHDLDAIMSRFDEECVFEAPRGPSPGDDASSARTRCVAGWGRAGRFVKPDLVGKCECARFATESWTSSCTPQSHCSRCRAATGSAFKAFAGIERTKLELTEGLDNLLVYGKDDLNDTRCGVCGSLLFSVVRDGEYVHVAMGSLVDDPGIRPAEHIFVGSKAPWFEITDDLPQAEELD